MHNTWMFYALIALVLWGASGVTQKLSTNRISSELSFLWFAAAMLLISIALAMSAPIRWHLPQVVLFLSISGGLLNGLGALTSFSALEAGGKASVVISLISLYPLLTVAAAVVFLHERLTPVQGFGIVLAILAALLLSLERSEPESQEGSTR